MSIKKPWLFNRKQTEFKVRAYNFKLRPRYFYILIHKRKRHIPLAENSELI